MTSAIQCDPPGVPEAAGSVTDKPTQPKDLSFRDLLGADVDGDEGLSPPTTHGRKESSADADLTNAVVGGGVTAASLSPLPHVSVAEGIVPIAEPELAQLSPGADTSPVEPGVSPVPSGLAGAIPSVGAEPNVQLTTLRVASQASVLTPMTPVEPPAVESPGKSSHETTLGDQGTAAQSCTEEPTSNAWKLAKIGGVVISEPSVPYKTPGEAEQLPVAHGAPIDSCVRQPDKVQPPQLSASPADSNARVPPGAPPETTESAALQPELPLTVHAMSFRDNKPVAGHSRSGNPISPGRVQIRETGKQIANSGFDTPVVITEDKAVEPDESQLSAPTASEPQNAKSQAPGDEEHSTPKVKTSQSGVVPAAATDSGKAPVSSGPSAPPTPPHATSTTNASPAAPQDLPGSDQQMGTPLPVKSNPSIADGHLTEAASETVHGARLFERGGQSEMRIDMHSPIFGSVEVRTVIRQNQVGLTIASEKGDLQRALGAEVSTVAAALRHYELHLDPVRFLDGGGSLANAFSPGSDAQQQRFHPPARQAWHFDSHVTDADENTKTESLLPRNTTLSIRA